MRVETENFRICLLLVIIIWSRAKATEDEEEDAGRVIKIYGYKYNNSVGLLSEFLEYDASLTSVVSFIDTAIVQNYASETSLWPYSNIKIALVVRNETQLQLLYFGKYDDESFAEYRIKDFNETILQVDVNWFVDRMYVLTRNNESVVKLYEIDMNYKLVALLNTLEYNGPLDRIHLSSNTLNGYVTYALGSSIYYTTINYFQYPLARSISDFNDFYTLVPVDNLLVETFMCNINYEKILNFQAKLCCNEMKYVVCVMTKSREIYHCQFTKDSKNCSCTRINDKKIKETALSYLRKQSSKMTDTFYIPPVIPPSPVEASKPFQECLRSCYISSELETQKRNYYMFSLFNQRHENLCKYEKYDNNNGRIFIKNLTKRQGKKREKFHLFEIIYHDTQLTECEKIRSNHTNLYYRYEIHVKSIRNQYELLTNSQIEGTDSKFIFYQSSRNLSKVHLKFEVSEPLRYLIDLYVQSPFEVTKRLESFYVNATSVRSNDIAFNITQKPGYLTDFYFQLGHNSVEIGFYMPLNTSKSDLKEYSYLIMDTERKLTKMSRLSEAQLTQETNLDTVKLFIFKINNLIEDTSYKIKILRSTSLQFHSLSNLIKFRTLKTPEIDILKITSSSISLKFKVKCYYEYLDYDKIHDFSLPQSIDDPFICKNVIYKWRHHGSENDQDWITQEESVFISASAMRPKFNLGLRYKVRYMLNETITSNIPEFSKEIQIQNVTPNSVYELQFLVQYYNDYTWKLDKPILVKTHR